MLGLYLIEKMLFSYTLPIVLFRTYTGTQ